MNVVCDKHCQSGGLLFLADLLVSVTTCCDLTTKVFIFPVLKFNKYFVTLGNI